MAPASDAPLPTVAVINGLQDTIDMLRFVLEDAGFRVVDTQARDVRRGEVDLAEFVQRHDAAVVLYDIAIPYDENWRALASGFDAHLTKPAEPAALAALLAHRFPEPSGASVTPSPA